MDERLYTYNVLRSQGYSKRNSARLAGYSSDEIRLHLNELENNKDGIAFREDLISKYGSDNKLNKEEVINDIHDYIHTLMDGDEYHKRSRVITDLYSIIMRSLDSDKEVEEADDNWDSISINVVRNRENDIDIDE